MNIVKVENGVAYRTSLSNEVEHISFINENEGYYFTEVEINPSFHYDFINEKVVLNEEKTKQKIINQNKNIALQFIEETNKYMLMDNFYDLTDLEIEELKNYRKSLKNVELELPTFPEFLKRFF